MKSKKKNVFIRLFEQVLRIAPGRMIEFFISRSTRRIHQAANAITLKDYSFFLTPSDDVGPVRASADEAIE